MLRPSVLLAFSFFLSAGDFPLAVAAEPPADGETIPDSAPGAGAPQTPLAKILSAASPTDSWRLGVLYDRDVFVHAPDLEEYNTPLKQEVFKKTPEYAERLSALNAERGATLKSWHYVKVEAPKIGNYSLKDRGFEIELHSNIGYGTQDARPPKSIDGILFPSLPIRLRPWGILDMPRDAGTNVLLVYVNEAAGLRIEESRAECILYVLFQVGWRQSVQYRFYNIRSNGVPWTLSDTPLAAKTARVVLGNRATGEVYFDREYRVQTGSGTKKK
ncbi:hypothetical protein L6R50_28155 [Myxococcota bacterium]|nr:hypothetical protein [Myxococcota bacterium]